MTKQEQPRKASNGTPAGGVAVAPPCAMVIFGATGDLTKRLVVPALYNLVTAKQLPKEFRLVGVGRNVETGDEWRDGLGAAMRDFVAHGGEFEADHIDETAWRWLGERMSYLQGDLNDPDTYRRLGAHLAELDNAAGTAGNRLFYLAVADRLFGPTVAGLGAAGLGHGHRRGGQIAGRPVVSRRMHDAHLNLPEPNGSSIVHLFYR